MLVAHTASRRTPTQAGRGRLTDNVGETSPPTGVGTGRRVDLVPRGRGAVGLTGRRPRPTLRHTAARIRATTVVTPTPRLVLYAASTPDSQALTRRPTTTGTRPRPMPRPPQPSCHSVICDP